MQDEAEHLFKRATQARDLSPLPYGPDLELASALLVELQLIRYGAGR